MDGKRCNRCGKEEFGPPAEPTILGVWFQHGEKSVGTEYALCDTCAWAVINFIVTPLPEYWERHPAEAKE